jgi:hypothetical protein
MQPTILLSLPTNLAEGDCACPDSSLEALHIAREHPSAELQVSLQIPNVSLSDEYTSDCSSKSA